MNKIYFFLIIFSLKFAYFTLHASDLNLKESIENSYRAENNILRDKYRNPYETLTFFGINKNKKILEVSPGNGYYTEIISHYMKDTENYYVTEYKFPPVEAVKIGQKKFKNYFNKKSEKFGKIKTLFFLKTIF